MTVYTIKGLFYRENGINKPVTYFGTLAGAIQYADINQHIYYGGDITICEGDTPKAIQKWNKVSDELGGGYEAEDWKIIRG